MIYCDDCQREARKPAISISGDCYCTRCAPDYGLFPGEFNSDMHSYDEWKDIIAKRQQPGEVVSLGVKRCDEMTGRDFAKALAARLDDLHSDSDGCLLEAWEFLLAGASYEWRCMDCNDYVFTSGSGGALKFKVCDCDHEDGTRLEVRSLIAGEWFELGTAASLGRPSLVAG